MPAIERGHNILNDDHVAALGSALYLVRPHLHPEDLSYHIQSGGPTAFAAPALVVGPLVLRLGEGVLDVASAQVAAVAAGAVRLVAAEVILHRRAHPVVRPLPRRTTESHRFRHRTRHPTAGTR